MNTSKLLLIWSIVTIGMIFWYIWHQNAAIQHMYQKQHLEHKYQKTEKDIRLLRQKIAERTTPANILDQAERMGLEKTPPQRIMQLDTFLASRKQEQ